MIKIWSHDLPHRAGSKFTIEYIGGFETVFEINLGC
jgi:hypothetical protein